MKTHTCVLCHFCASVHTDLACRHLYPWSKYRLDLYEWHDGVQPCLVLLVDWIIALSHSNKEKTTHIGHFYTWLFYTILISLSLRVKQIKSVEKRSVFFPFLLWEKEQSPNPLSSRKQGWIPSSCHFGKGFWGTTLKFTNAAPSMNARSLQAIPCCKGDKSTIKTI